MKIADLHFKDEEIYGNSKKPYSEIKTILLEGESKDFTEKVKKLIRNATDTDNFIENFLNGTWDWSVNKYKRTSAYRAVMKVYNESGVWQYLCEMFGGKAHKTSSDAGGLKIGNDDFSIIIPNGCGDNATKYAVMKSEDAYGEDLMSFFATVNGTINIYDYDCGGEICDTLCGRYGIYFYDGLVLFEKWDD